MKDPEATILNSRYACIDFSGIHGFPNHFPKDAYFLRNGPKFNGEDLSLTLKHISDFCHFAELLRVKHEDVCIRLFYDSLQGKCKQWIECFPVKSIKSIQDFWFMFLEEWIDRSELVANSPSVADFKKWNDDHSKEETNESFSLSLSSYMKSFDCKAEDRMRFLDEFAEDLEKEIEGLEGQIQAYIFHDHDRYSQKFSMAERKETMLVPLSFTIEELNTVVENQFAQLESFKERQADHVFWDPIADYMEEFYSPVFQLFYEDQRPALSFRKQSSYAGPFQWQLSHHHIGSEFQCSLRNQISDKTEDWLHWKFHID